MQFFDDKEEVIDIQLTQYGKHLLSIGKWKPVYYSFFDDNVLYDGAFANLTESQNAIEDRIQDNTPQLHTQHVFSGRETDFLRIVKEKGDWWRLPEVDRIRMQSTPEREYSLSDPLGSSLVGSQQLPRWSVRLLCGEVEGCTALLTGSLQDLAIPQIEIDVTYRGTPHRLQDKSNSSATPTQLEAQNLMDNIYPDKSFLKISNDTLLIEVEELHTDFDVENFDIEVFKIEDGNLPGTDTPNVEYHNQLFFKKNKEQIQNDILMFDRPQYQNVKCDSTYVGYYFDILTDSEIPSSVICECAQNLKSKGIYVDEEYDCADVPSPKIGTPYQGIDTTGGADGLCEDEPPSDSPSPTARDQKKKDCP